MKDLEGYGAMLAGFWSLEFLDGFISVFLSFFSTILVIISIVAKIIDIREKLKGK